MLAALAAPLCACSEYFDHADPMVPYAGEANAANRAAQMVDPWSRDSRDRNFATNGARMQRAMDRYKSGASSAPISSTSSSSSSSDSGQSSSSSSTGGSSATQQ